MLGTLKRLIDIILAAFMLIILSPVLLVGCLTVLVTMGRPVIFMHDRSGKNGVPFRIIKLRTMLNDPDGKMTDRERVTSVGLHLRKFSIDELPQLLNVLGGSMSIVGPRPLLPEYNSRYTEIQAKRLYVKPGLTGLAQISGRNELSWDEKIELDVQYVDTQSIWLDFKIILQTPLVVLLARGFKRSGEAQKFGE